MLADTAPPTVLQAVKEIDARATAAFGGLTEQQVDELPYAKVRELVMLPFTGLDVDARDLLDAQMYADGCANTGSAFLLGLAAGLRLAQLREAAVHVC